jgi:hypothetical protein
MNFVLPSVDNDASVHHHRLYNNRVTLGGTVKFNFETMFLVGFNGFGGKIKGSLSVQQIEISVRIMKGPDSGGGWFLCYKWNTPLPLSSSLYFMDVPTLGLPIIFFFPTGQSCN